MFVLLLNLNSVVSFVLTNVIYDESTIYVEMCRFSVFALSWEEKFAGPVRFCWRDVTKSAKWVIYSDSEYVLSLLILILYSYVLNVKRKVSIKLNVG